MGIDRKDWYDERNWTPFKVVDGREGLRVSLSGWTTDEIEGLTNALKSANIEFGTKKASVSQYNIQAGDPTLRVLGSENVEKLKSFISQSNEDDKLNKHNEEFWKNLDERVSSAEAEEEKRKAGERSAKFWEEWAEKGFELNPNLYKYGPKDNYGQKVADWVKKFWEEYDNRSSDKTAVYISPYQAFVGKVGSKGLEAGGISEKEVFDMFAEAQSRAKAMGFKGRDGKSLRVEEWTDSDGNSLLMHMIRQQQMGMVNHLINTYEKLVDLANKAGLKPIHEAVKIENLSLAQILKIKSKEKDKSATIEKCKELARENAAFVNLKMKKMTDKSARNEEYMKLDKKRRNYEEIAEYFEDKDKKNTNKTKSTDKNMVADAAVYSRNGYGI